MERREFLHLGTVAGVGGVAALGGSSCLAVNSRLRTGSEMGTSMPDMRDYLRKVDQGMAHIDTFRMSDAVSPEKNRARIDWSSEDQLVRNSLKTLYFTGMFGDLPDVGQVHPGMQRRLWQVMDTMDQAVLGTVDYLKNRTPAENAELKRVLSQRSNPGMRIAEQLDSQAQAISLSLRRRFQTRNMFAQASFRLAHQDPETLYHEYITKVEKMAARAGSAEQMKRIVAAGASEKIFWERQQHLAALARQWELSGEGFIQKSEEEGEDKPGSRTVRVGAKMMGIGIIVGVVSLGITLAGGFVAIFGVTVGALLLVIGLITMIIGAII